MMERMRGGCYPAYGRGWGECGLKVIRRLKVRVKRLRERVIALATPKPKPHRPVLDLVSISMVRNEQDIIEPFIRHHAAVMDLMFILDNRSTDRTRAILQDLARELGNVIVTDCPDEGYNQSQIMSAALQSVQAAVFADYVFFLDADEFLATRSKAGLLNALREVPKEGMALLPWKTIIPDPDIGEDQVPDPLHRLKWLRVVETRNFSKAVLAAAGGVMPDLKIAQGNHSISDGTGEPLPALLLPDLPLYHMPLRSSEQLASKGLIGWQANLARNDRQPEIGEAAQWKRLHDLAQAGQRPSPQDLTREALRYAHSDEPPAFEAAVVPFDHGVRAERRYSDGRFARAETLLADAARFGYADFPVPARPRSDTANTGIANAFDSEWHWDLLFVDVAPIRWIIEKERPASILDLGCGNGLYPRLYQHLGVQDVLGVDGLDLSATVLDDRTYRECDLQKPFDAGRRFDLVVCLEVLEHLYPEASAELLDSIARHATDTILFSMAEPGQPGNGHINCLSIETVLKLWEKRGWYPDLGQTLAMRGLATMSWFRRNMLVLRRKQDARYPDAAARLRQIGSLGYTWYGQGSGVRAFAFQEPLPRAEDGYGILRQPSSPRVG